MANPAPSGTWTWATTATVTALTIMAALGTLLIRIPIPATTGYFNVGDVFVILAGLWLGPWAGLLVGALGPTAADAIGYPQFILATAVTKGLEGFMVGLIGYGKSTGLGRKGFAAAIGGIIIVVGYFFFEAIVYPALGRTIPFFNVTTFEAACVEAPLNFFQGCVSAFVAVGMWRAVSGLPPRASPTKEKQEAQESEA